MQYTTAESKARATDIILASEYDFYKCVKNQERAEEEDNTHEV